MNSGHIICQQLPTGRRILRVAAVTETYPPEINGVAMTIGRMELVRRAHPVAAASPAPDGVSAPVA